jgi:hypothetical protein
MGLEMISVKSHDTFSIQFLKRPFFFAEREDSIGET